jgi:NAD-dependent SIR2 family protein deacetylase
LAIPCLKKSWRRRSVTPSAVTLFIVVGSSLVVYSAADMPRIALESGARLVIINREETPLNHICHLRFYEKGRRGTTTSDSFSEEDGWLVDYHSFSSTIVILPR